MNAQLPTTFPRAAEAAVLLGAIGATLRRAPELRLETLIVFLSVCESEGLSIKDIVYICGLGESMVSRAVDSLRKPENGALLTIARHETDGRRRLVYLSDQGAMLKEELTEIFSGIARKNT